MSWPWVTLVLLGAYHGLNPGMGWLFAVSRGLQERRGAAVTGALAPIALGHALAIGLALGIVAIGEVALGSSIVRWVAAVVVVGFGTVKFVRHRHPRWVGMRVGFFGLLGWSFLAATAHGAGLMLVPLFVGRTYAHSCAVRAGSALGRAAGPGAYLGAIALHTGAMLVVAGALALVVYHKIGLAFLRRFWFNLDRAWAAALVISGIAALVV